LQSYDPETIWFAGLQTESARQLKLIGANAPTNAEKSINKSEVARKTGISNARISELNLNTSTKLRAEELYVIALSITVDPCEILNEVCGKLKLGK
jgi:DNA-binding Xre family transcriptional regulator